MTQNSFIFQDAELREGVKEYSDWPTIPQLYIKQEFVGGADILRQMYMDGSLEKLFTEKEISHVKVKSEWMRVVWLIYFAHIQV